MGVLWPKGPVCSRAANAVKRTMIVGNCFGNCRPKQFFTSGSALADHDSNQPLLGTDLIRRDERKAVNCDSFDE
jgi:hypothetical protein